MMVQAAAKDVMDCVSALSEKEEQGMRCIAVPHHTFPQSTMIMAPSIRHKMHAGHANTISFNIMNITDRIKSR
eukprot:scaffold70099_cov21-Prasinocladus_malaysianus.AAC.3